MSECALSTVHTWPRGVSSATTGAGPLARLEGPLGLVSAAATTIVDTHAKLRERGEPDVTPFTQIPIRRRRGQRLEQTQHGRLVPGARRRATLAQDLSNGRRAATRDRRLARCPGLGRKRASCDSDRRSPRRAPLARAAVWSTWRDDKPWRRARGSGIPLGERREIGGR